jgi:hypothetical protein
MVRLRLGVGLTKLWQILRSRLLRFHFFAIGILGAG